MHGLIRRFAMVSGAAALALGFAAGAAITTGTAADTAAAAATGGPVTFRPPPSGTPSCAVDTYTVPLDVGAVLLTVIGEAGERGEGTGKIIPPGSGGKAELVQAEVRVRFGETLYVNVANNGSGGFGASQDGGDGGDSSWVTTQPPLGGGRGCFFGAGSLVAMAGGGGGGGQKGAFGSGGNGGSAGFAAGGNGSAGDDNSPSAGAGGGGGTQTAGGAGGNPASTGAEKGEDGFDLVGGSGGDGGNGSGGGGGGYFGGGGGGGGDSAGGGGGGGGSSFVVAGATKILAFTTSDSPSVTIQPEFVGPGAPTNVSAVAGNQQATVSFTSPTDDGGAPIVSYTVYAKTKSGAFDQLGEGAGSPITVTNLTAGQSYVFTVTATNRAKVEGAASQPSNPVIPYRIPGPPTITSATAGNGQATIAFTKSSADQNLGNPITSYTVTARAGVGVTAGPGITATGTTSPVTVTGLTNGTNYTITVYATNAAGNGPESAPQVVFPETVPGAPTNVSATNATPVGAGTGTVNLTFTPPASDGGTPVLNYTAVSSPGGITATAGAGTPGIQVTGLTIGTSYTFTVYATNGVGNGPASDPSNAVTPTPVGMPSPPQNPGAAALDQAAYVSCLPPATDGGSPIVSYTVTSSPGVITATGSSCPILVTGLTNETKYTFTVTATNANGGTSQPSQPTSTVTPHAPSCQPAPRNDNFANAQVIRGTSGSVAGTNCGATLEPGEPNINDNAGGASVWYKWTVPTTGRYRVDTCSATPAVFGLIGTFIGNSLGNLIQTGPGPGLDLCPAGQAGATLLTNTLGAGQTIYIKFDGVNEGGSGANPPYQGPFTLEWSPQS